MIPDDFIQRLLGRVDIVDIIDKHVKLKKAGQNYTACCPFHNERTPSFSVSPTKQFYHCFGCGAHGTAIRFLMEYSGIGFRDAVKELADAVGMAMPVESREADERRLATNSLLDVMAIAARFFRAQLKCSASAIAYLKQRGVSGEIAARFGLGYAPDDWQGLKGGVADYSASALVEAGLVIEKDGKRYDRFRDRVMFPIHDTRGNVIGFGGRVIGSGEPKYLNSPETTLFEKGRELYGLFQARKAIRDTQTAIVVEGYMDVVALAQGGVENAVATLGTATTAMHIEKLLSIADNVIFCFDGDVAGRRAAWRAAEQSLSAVRDGKDIRFIFLPPEDDPDSFIRSLGKHAFLALFDGAKTLTTFLFEVLRQDVDLQTDEGRTRLLTSARPLFARIGAPALGIMMQRRLADMTGLGLVEIQRLVPTAAGRPGAAPGGSGGKVESVGHLQGHLPNRGRGDRVPRPKTLRPPPAVYLAIRLLAKPSLAGRFDLAVDESDATEPASVARLAQFIRDHDFEVNQAQVFEHFRDGPDASLIERAARDAFLTDIDVARPEFDLDAEFDDALAKLRAEAKAAAAREAQLRRARELGLA
jgi:DNA primase